MQDDPEFEMLVHVLKAKQHLEEAMKWNPAPTMQNQYDMRGAVGLCRSVYERCSEDNQRLADGTVVNG